MHAAWLSLHVLFIFLLLHQGFSIALQSISALSILQSFTALVSVVFSLLLQSSFSVAHGPFQLLQLPANCIPRY